MSMPNVNKFIKLKYIDYRRVLLSREIINMPLSILKYSLLIKYIANVNVLNNIYVMHLCFLYV